MIHTNATSPLSSNSLQHKEQSPDPLHAVSSTNRSKHRVDWHKAAACAIEIELRDYADLLQFFSEYLLGKNNYRIDFLVIKKLSEQPVPKNIARIFKKYNLFEFKGIHSSVTVRSYYKTIGYAGLFIDQTNETEPCTCLSVSISFLTFHYPVKLMKHLRKERNLTVEKSSAGIYYISKETFEIQIIVIQELPPEENLYLYCLADRLQDACLVNRLADDYNRHAGQQIYADYLQQLTNATTLKGGSQMVVCEGLLNMFGTSSEEIIAKAKKESDEYYLPKHNELMAQNEYYKTLLKQNNISFD